MLIPSAVVNSTEQGIRDLTVARWLGIAVISATAQINTDVIEKYRTELQKQATDSEMKRERGTQPQDWLFNLADGVTTRQITFYSDGTPCYGRLFFPKGFTTSAKRPAVVVGHGINAQAVGIESTQRVLPNADSWRWRSTIGPTASRRRRAARTGYDDRRRAVTGEDARIQIGPISTTFARRKTLSAVSPAGEPGVDPDRIGVWGSSNGASGVPMVAALACVSKLVAAGAAGGLNESGPVAVPPQCSRMDQASAHRPGRRGGWGLLVSQQDRYVEQPVEPRVSPWRDAGPDPSDNQHSVDSRRKGRVASASCADRTLRGVKGVQGNVSGRRGALHYTLPDVLVRGFRGGIHTRRRLVLEVSGKRRNALGA